jgi:hypothetical protein
MTSDEFTKSRIIPSRRRTSSIPNLLYPEPAPSTPAEPEAQGLELALAQARAERARTASASDATRLPLSRPSSTDQTTWATSKDYSGLIRRRPRRSMS